MTLQVKRARVLIVDDESLTLTSLADFLQEMGYATAMAESGETAIRLQREQAFDVCIVDIRMPRMGGVETLLALHTIAPQSRYLVYTGSPQFTLSPALRAIGLTEADVIRKPLQDLTVFVGHIEDVLSRE
ncbi:MAG TPA: response regulator [Anaerolineae bacterium]|nr:response regulator [Anaerolineae bacterium]HQK13793.1 response regulator [Anaerolineae bacterium]